MRDRWILGGDQKLLRFAHFDLATCVARAVNYHRSRALPMIRSVDSLVIAIILRWLHLRRFGTSRAFVVRGHEYFQP